MHADNPSFLIERVFSRIAGTRMAGLPLNNPALRVEAVGFRPWNGLWLGVLVTPWAINLMLLPGSNQAFRRLGPDERQSWTFPSGDYEFLGLEEGELGLCQMLSLFSPTFEFASQEAARHLAAATLDVLLAPSEATAARRREQARLEGRSLAAQPLSRRAFFGALLGNSAEG